MNPAADVVLQVSMRKGRMWVDLAMGPILRYCPACRHLSPTPYPYSGSRYGQVGRFTCERCGVEVALTDGDCHPPIHYSVPSRAGSPGHHVGVSIWHEELYGVAPQDFRRIEEWTGLRFFEGVDSKGLPFHGVMERLEAWVAERGSGAMEPGDETGYGEWMEEVFGDAAARNAGGLRPRELPQPFIASVPEPFRRWLALYHAAWALRGARAGEGADG